MLQGPINRHPCSFAGTGVFAAGASGAGIRSNNGSANYADADFNLSNVARTSTETRPSNVAVTYCMYSGFQSGLQAGVATLASLSDVSIAGALTGQVLSYNGSAWVASNTISTGGGTALGDRITSGTASLIANFNQGISSSVPLEVSCTVKMLGTGAEACVAGTVGTFRFNPINGVPQVCR